ncbi:MAG: hypothetical protein KJ970_04940, partial [Candidatus Eisenbacteria bacterium]|nr:hypothetical protein [Candidatus Eisenbacteria bacterium]
MSKCRTHFKPPHCPNPHCRYHKKPEGWSYKKAGFFSRKTKPYRVQRYKCQHCDRDFSRQTFQADYWLKRPELFRAL